MRVLAIAALLLAAPMLRSSDDMETCVYKDEQGKTLPYRLLKPANYDAKQSYPLVLFFHGAGERGDDNIAQLKHGVKVFATPENRAKYPCFVFAPQCPKNQKWADVNWSAPSHTLPPKVAEPMRLALEAVAGLQKSFNLDSKRIYVTGLSMGGYGTWDIIVRKPDFFAAAVPVCGGADDTKLAVVAKLPIWVFHGDKDTTVKTDRSRSAVAALKAVGGDPKYTEYPGVSHDSWTKAYSDPALLEWLFAQKRN